MKFEIVMGRRGNAVEYLLDERPIKPADAQEIINAIGVQRDAAIEFEKAGRELDRILNSLGVRYGLRKQGERI